MESKVRRPMIMGWPRVSSLKRRWSAGRRQGRRLSRPIARLAAMAAIRVILIRPLSYGNLRLDRRAGLIAGEAEVLVLDVEERGPRRVEGHGGQRPGLAAELQAGLLQVGLGQPRRLGLHQIRTRDRKSVV